jgi:hypothetical protein
MNKAVYFSILKRVFSTEKVFIRNTNIPVCSNCVHFIPEINNYPYDLPPDNTHSKCKKFGAVNLVTGLIEYDLAIDCRDNVNKCGRHGSGYKKK